MGMRKETGPEGFWKRYEGMLREDFPAFQRYQNQSLPKTIRINTLRNSVSEFLELVKITHPDWRLTPHPFSCTVYFIDRTDKTFPLGKTIEHLQGRFYIQEASSSLPPLAMDVFPGQKVLDIAAAPGSKTTQLAALLGDDGLLLANEFSSSRIKTLAFNLQKNAVSRVSVSHFSGEKIGIFLPNFFDRVLLDSPCTGEGVFRKMPDALLNWSEKRINIAAKLQKKLLCSAFQSLIPGGILTYSTCTFAPEENEAVVEYLLQKFPEETEIIDLSSLFLGAENAPGLSCFRGTTFLHGKKMLRIWPHLFNSEGFFVASIRKKRVYSKKINIRSHSLRKKYYPMPKKYCLPSFGIILRHKDHTVQMVQEYFLKKYYFEFSEKSFFFQRENILWLVPNFGEVLIKNIRLERPGVQIGKIIGKGTEQIRISHECALAFGAFFKGDGVIELCLLETKQFLSGKNISSLPHIPMGDIILRYKGIPLGTAKNMGKVLKNNIPRNFIVQ
jgi:16S rRNA (cytosine1407-C5)-methyltransferase